MIRITALSLATLALCAACGSMPVEQREIPPPRPERSLYAPQSKSTTDEAATERFLDREIQRREVPAPRPTNAERYSGAAQGGSARMPTDERATELFLDNEIARRSYVPPVPQTERIIERVYEPVYVDRQSYHYGYDRYRSSFPWHTAVGAGLGAIIGHQSDHRDEGALLGAGIGFLFDAFRWH